MLSLFKTILYIIFRNVAEEFLLRKFYIDELMTTIVTEVFSTFNVCC